VQSCTPETTRIRTTPNPKPEIDSTERYRIRRVSWLNGGETDLSTGEYKESSGHGFSNSLILGAPEPKDDATNDASNPEGFLASHYLHWRCLEKNCRPTDGRKVGKSGYGISTR